MAVLPEFGIPLVKTQIQHRQVYRQSAVFGQTVHNLGNKACAAVKEIESLTNEVFRILSAKSHKS
ncbi:hypothetical protein [Nostoc sp.]|uniref:hypothetical protein n=1 Tax=Nostoc sp. TaxID=1180 RepID=UPI002FFBB338